VKILIVKLSAIGDVIHTLPALNALRSRWPAAQITWLVEEAAAGLVIDHPALDRVLVSGRKRWLQMIKSGRPGPALGEIRRFLADLRDTRYDLVLDFQALLKSALWVALCRADRKVGFGRGLEHMEHSYRVLTEPVPPPSMEVHALKRGLMLLEAISVPAGKIEYRLPVTEAHRREIARQLEAGGAGTARWLVAINPVAKWETKLWPAAAFAETADRLAEASDVALVFTGGPGDRCAVEEILLQMNQKALNLAGKTSLMSLAALYRRADLVISTDTGPMHLAAAVDTPVVALFGPTAPWRTGPYGSAHRVVRIEVECSPCYKRRCPDPVCMTRIDPDRVLAAVESTGVFQ
jgi:3-deoxy-D-manno-octulosonic-acid transferase/heptosyltransferase-1